jgi:Proteasome maturation factor UMP1
LPGRPATNLGWEALSGELDEFGPESYLGRPENAMAQPPDLHSQMEAALKMKTKPMTRGIF